MSQCAQCPVVERKHSKWLHLVWNKQTVSSSVNTVTDLSSSTAGNEMESFRYTAFRTPSRTVYLPTVAVAVNGVRVYAMLDSCSTDSFVSESFAARLNLKEKRTIMS